MSETEVTITESRAVQEQQPRFWQSVFGHLTTRKFWVEVARVMLSEALNACAVVVAGRLLWYGEGRRDKKTADLMSGSHGSSPVAAKAFGGSYSPNPSYNSYPVPTQPQGDVRFPGFGGPR